MTTRVLIVDDDPEHYDLIAEMFGRMRNQEFELEWCAAYAPALVLMRENRHDVYLLDYQLGGQKNSIDLLREVFPDGVMVPVILLTGAGGPEVDAEALQMGVADYFDKAEVRVPLLERSIRYAIERKRVEATLRSLYQQVSQLEQLKTDIIRVAAHDLLSPVSFILNYLPMLQMELGSNLPQDHREYLETIRESLQRMQQVLKDILSLERLDSLQKVNTERVDLDDLAAKIIPQHTPVTLELPAAPLFVYGNQALLREAMVNLLNNAIKYTPPSGQIIVRVWADAHSAYFEVEDTGYGIPEDQQSRLFQPFFRAQTAEASTIAGTGLGLHLVKRIIERHSGQVFFKSVYGKGSTFGFVLPL